MATAEENISYSVASKGRKPSVDANLTLTYSTTPNRNGSFNVESITGTYTVTETRHGETTTTTLDVLKEMHPHRRGNNDNRIYLSKGPGDEKGTIVDQHGISFYVKDPLPHRPNHVERINFFYSNENGQYQQFGSQVSGKATVTFGSAAIAAPAAAAADVVAAPLCFASGTRIRTTRGEVAVEALAVGDIAVTASGTLRPICWLGHRTIDCAARISSDLRPVRIRAGAFGGNRPERDLFLSPGHPVLVGEGADEVLVPIMCLINGTTVARTTVETVTYWHVELDAHDILLAEGLPAESFLDDGTRPWFAIDAQACAADEALLDPDFIPAGLGARCRPVAIDGPAVEAERRRLDALFVTSLAEPCAWPAATALSLDV